MDAHRGAGLQDAGEQHEGLGRPGRQQHLGRGPLVPAAHGGDGGPLVGVGAQAGQAAHEPARQPGGRRGAAHVDGEVQQPGGRLRVPVVAQVGLHLSRRRERPRGRRARGRARRGGRARARDRGVRVRRVVRVVVRGLGGADLVLEAGQGDAVRAGVAVHPQVTAVDLGPPLEDDTRQRVTRADQVGGADVDVRVLGGPRPGLRADPVGQHPGEQEPGQHDDPPEAQAQGAVQPGRHRRLGERHEGRLDRADRATLLQQAGGLRDLGVGVGIGRAAADQHDGRAGPVGAGDERLDPRLGDGEQLGGAAERAAVAEGQPRVAPLLAGERCRDVALAVPGRDEHERDDVDARVAGLDEAGDRVLDRRRRELEEAAGDVGERRLQLHPLDQLGELGAALRALGAVPDDEQGGAPAGGDGHGFSS
jgi:hypothetical protein